MWQQPRQSQAQQPQQQQQQQAVTQNPANAAAAAAAWQAYGAQFGAQAAAQAQAAQAAQLQQAHQAQQQQAAWAAYYASASQQSGTQQKVQAVQQPVQQVQMQQQYAATTAYYTPQPVAAPVTYITQAPPLHYNPSVGVTVGVPQTQQFQAYPQPVLQMPTAYPIPIAQPQLLPQQQQLPGSQAHNQNSSSRDRDRSNSAYSSPFPPRSNPATGTIHSSDRYGPPRSSSDTYHRRDGAGDRYQESSGTPGRYGTGGGRDDYRRIEYDRRGDAGFKRPRDDYNGGGSTRYGPPPVLPPPRGSDRPGGGYGGGRYGGPPGPPPPGGRYGGPHQRYGENRSMRYEPRGGYDRDYYRGGGRGDDRFHYGGSRGDFYDRYDRGEPLQYSGKFEPEIYVKASFMEDPWAPPPPPPAPRRKSEDGVAGHNGTIGEKEGEDELGDGAGSVEPTNVIEAENIESILGQDGELSFRGSDFAGQEGDGYQVGPSVDIGSRHPFNRTGDALVDEGSTLSFSEAAGFNSGSS
ncbi:hypothetical protein BC830DRAFT_1128350, partial [Chytriomyces sp. MP71]